MPLVNLKRFSAALRRLLHRRRGFRDIQDIISYHFRDPSILSEALTHRSYAKSSSDDDGPTFERLEFLGDSILGMIVAEDLYKMFPGKPEGKLTKLKAALVNEQTLSTIAREMGLGDHILLSAEEAAAGGRDRPSITSDCFEAVIAAIYLDGGLEPARKFVGEFIMSRIEDVQADASIRNFKGELLELTQGQGAGVPRYEVIDERGPDHDKTFTVTVHGFGKKLGVGKGHSKKEAEQNAAHEALRKARQMAGNNNHHRIHGREER